MDGKSIYVASSVSAQVALQPFYISVVNMTHSKLHPLFQRKSLFNAMNSTASPPCQHLVASSVSAQVALQRNRRIWGLFLRALLHPLFQRKSLFNLGPNII